MERKKRYIGRFPGKIMYVNGEWTDLTTHERVFSLGPLADLEQDILFLLWCHGSGNGAPETQRKIFVLSFESRAKEEIRVPRLRPIVSSFEKTFRNLSTIATASRWTLTLGIE
jgi:hypothetical protein